MAEYNLKKFAQLVKADEKTHTVYALVTDESVDRDGEICDYFPTAQFYREWNDNVKEATSRAGQEVSLGTVRLQHTLEIAGKVIQVDFDDQAKTIHELTMPIDDRIWKMVAGGYVTGYSQGGRYAYRNCGECGGDCGEPGNLFCQRCNKMVTVHYACKPHETSYVDWPSNTNANFVTVKMDGSTEIKKFVDGGMSANFTAMSADDMKQLFKDFSSELVASITSLVRKGDDPKTKRVAGQDLKASSFAYVGDPDHADTWHYPIKFLDEEKTKSHIRNALAQWAKPDGQTNIPEEARAHVHARIVSAARQHGIEITSDKADTGEIFEAPPAVSKAASEEEEEMKLSEVLKAARMSLASHFGKAAVHHNEMADIHKALADENAGKCETCKSAMEHHKAAADIHKACVGNDEGSMKTFHVDMAANHTEMVGVHKAHAAHAKAIGANHMSLHKKHTAHAVHMEKMAKAQENDEGMKALLGDLFKAEMSTEGDIEIPGITSADVETAVAKSFGTAITGMTESLNTTIEAMMEKSLSNFAEKTLEPTLVKVAGKGVTPPIAINRGGQDITGLAAPAVAGDETAGF